MENEETDRFDGECTFEHRKGTFYLTDKKLVLRNEGIEINLKEIQKAFAVKNGIRINLKNGKTLEFDVLRIIQFPKGTSPENYEDRKKQLRDRIANAINLDIL